jgi:hypothetical protein
MAKIKPDWEKLLVYLTVVGSLATLFFYIADMKERTVSLEVKMEAVQEKLK